MTNVKKDSVITSVENVLNILKEDFESIGETYSVSPTTIEYEKTILNDFLESIPFGGNEVQFIIPSKFDKAACYVIGNDGLKTYLDFHWILH